MANRTITEARQIHGTNPQYLLEKIVRTRIYESIYWKESCFGLTAETLIDKAVQLNCIGGQFGNQKPTEFLCLTLKLLQLQPEKEIIVEYILNEDFKYLRALGAFYLRLTASALDVYRYLEPLLDDFRKIRAITTAGSYTLTYMDDFVDSLLKEERVCDTILPRLTKRHVLEDLKQLEPRVSALEDELDAMDADDDKPKEENDGNGDAERTRHSRNGDHDDDDVEDGEEKEIPSSSNGRHRDYKERESSSRDDKHSTRIERRHHDDEGERRRSVSPRHRSPAERRRESSDHRRDRDRRDYDKRDHDSSSSSRRDSYDSRRDRDRDHRDRDYNRRDRDYDSRRDRDYDRDRRDGDDGHRPSSSRDYNKRDDERSSREERGMDAEDSSLSRNPKKGWSKSKVDSLFKKKATSGITASSSQQPPAASNSKSSNSGGGGASKGGAGDDQLSIEETNKLRISLGLAPLKT
ncbi:hypothetical protein SmJEL517_g01989 [Synchytrium microbalum]|uniref:Pre-mRNA-splicing factor 38 n=1 Tax=Synchytrium microbalum TaxID=1806994 RepID=A0A507C8I2_9FUNG|nr:uncharacterized protein SmJEL517_g01989 [Synchytrium microbalum]TPX35638.1 hypothetical protein SmJEL517_g01989 [Synchytrium microbalum]